MAVSTLRSRVKTVTTPSLTLDSSINLGAYIPTDAIPLEITTFNKTAFAKFGKNPNNGEWWVQLTDWTGSAVTGTSTLTIKYFI